MRSHPRTALLVAAAALVAGGLLADAGWDAGARYRERPDSTRTADWPRQIPASTSFNERPVTVVAGALNAGDDQYFRWDSSVRKETEAESWIFVQCDTGRIEVEGPSIGLVSGPCQGINGSIAGVMTELDLMQVRVSEPQRHRWGVAVYR